MYRTHTPPAGPDSARPTVSTGRFVSVLAAAWLVVAALPAGIFAQIGTTAPSGPAGDPSMRADFMERALLPQAQDAPTLLTVSGEGRVEAPSDRARVSLAVVTEAETAREAANANTERMEALTAAVREIGDGVEGFELSTRNFSVYPVYRPGDQGDREIVGYTVQNTLEVSVDDVVVVGDLLDTALGAGANRVSGLQFEVSEVSPYRREALQAAVSDARAEAEAIAEAMGMSVGTAVEVRGGADPTFPFQPPMAAQTMALREAVPVEPGAQTVTANVTIQYRLEPAP